MENPAGSIRAHWETCGELMARMLLLTSLLAALPVFAQDARPQVRFGGPDSVPNQIEEDANDARQGRGIDQLGTTDHGHPAIQPDGYHPGQ